MIKVIHRVNTIEFLKSIPSKFGVEIDIRSNAHGGLYLNHELEDTGVTLEEYLQNYNHRLLILNVKEEGIEEEVLRLVKKYNIEDYFFLDCSFPAIIKLIKQGEHNIAIRFSQFEGLDTVVNMAYKAKWVWVDTFSYNPLSEALVNHIKSLGYKICFVSPELQGQPERRKIYLKQIKKLYLNAICTDIIEEEQLWLQQ